MKIYRPQINKIEPSFKPEKLFPLLKYDTGLITDVMARKNAIYGLSKLSGNDKFVGEAITVDAMPGCNLMVHMALDLAFEGSVLVIDGKGDLSTSVFGEIQAYYAKTKGVRAVIVDGVIRDLKQIKEIGLTVFAKGTSPIGPHKGWGDSINTPISCSGAVVNPGDVLLGDEDGIAVIKKELFDKIIQLCQDKVKEEKDWVKKIDSGGKLIEILGLKENLHKFKIDYESFLKKQQQ